MTERITADGARLGNSRPELRDLVVGAGVMPPVVDELRDVGEAVDRTGACVIRGVDPTRDGLATMATNVMAERFRALGIVRGERCTRGDELALHTDAGALRNVPDLLFLLSAEEATDGGASLVVDGYRLLAELDRRGDFAELGHYLRTESLDFEATYRNRGAAAVGQAVTSLPTGRVLFNRTPYQAPVHPKPSTLHLNRLWDDVLASAWAAAPRLMLRRGELLCLDNYRVVHGRTQFRGPRLLFAAVAWSTGSTLALDEQRRG